MRRAPLLSYSLPTSLLLAIAACGDGSAAEPARFSSATDLQRQRAITAGAGLDATLAYLIGGFVNAVPPESRCPTLAATAATITATFDCTGDDGQRVDGRIITTNPPPIFGEGGSYDPTKDTIVTFAGYHQHADTATDEVVLDGTITVRPDRSMVVTLDAQLGGLAAVTDATFVTGADGLMSARAGSAIEVDGLGRATIAGAWSLDSDAPAGALELVGADRLRADFAGTIDGCVPIAIDGQAAGQLCGEPSTP